MSSQIVEASAREVFEAYYQAIERGDWPSARFWRPILIERLEVLSGAKTNRGGSATAHREQSEGL